MDFGRVYMNKSKHSSDLDIASLHQALHDLQSYMHLILRIIGGLAGFTSDHLSSELINELSKISHDSTVQVLFPYKSSSVRTMPSVPQSYYMDSKGSDYSSHFNVGGKDSPWSGVQYSTFFSNLAKSLPASSATDSRESHQLGLNQVVRPNPRKPPVSLFATYNPGLKLDKPVESPKTKVHKQSLEICQPIKIKAYQSGFNNGNDHAKFKVSSGKEIDYGALKLRNVSIEESKESTHATRDSLNVVGERDTVALSEQCSRTLKFDVKSVSVLNQGYPDTTNTTSVKVGEFVQRSSSTEVGKKRLGSDSNSGGGQIKSLALSQGSLNRNGDQISPESKAKMARPVFFYENLDMQTDEEHTKTSTIIELLKTDVIKEQSLNHISEVKLVERNYKTPPLTVTTNKSFIGQQEKISFNETELSKISLVDVKLLQRNVSNDKPDQTPSSKAGKEIYQENCIILSKNTSNCGQDLRISPSPTITDQPLASVNGKVNKEQDAAIKSRVEMGEYNNESDSEALFNTTAQYLSYCENVDKASNPPHINIEQSKKLETRLQTDQIKEDDIGDPLVAVSVCDPPKFIISNEEPLNVFDNKIPSSNIISSSLASFDKTNEDKDTITITEVKSRGCNNKNDPAAFLRTSLESLSGESGCNELSSTQSVIEFSKPSVSNKSIGPKREEIASCKTKSTIIIDQELTCKIDKMIEVANLIPRGWLNTRGCPSNLSEVINTQSSKKDLARKNNSETPLKFAKVSSNPTVYHEDLEERNSAVDANLERMLPARSGSSHLKLPDMPDLINHSVKLSVQNAPFSVKNEDCMDLMDVPFTSRVIKNATPITKCLYSRQSSSECTELFTANNNSEEEVADNKQFDLGIIKDETCKKVTSAKLRETVTEFEDTSGTNELSDDDSEGKLVIDIPDAELAHRPSANSVSTKEMFNHPKKNWRIKMLQDDNQDEDIDAIRRLKPPNLVICQDFLHLSRDSTSNLSVDSSTTDKMGSKRQHERIGAPGEEFAEVRFSPGKQKESTSPSADDKDAVKSMSSDVSTSDNTTDAAELFHNKLKHLPIEVQHGLRKRNEVLMKYLSTVYPNSQLQGEPSADSFDRAKDPDLGLSALDKSVVSRIFDNADRVEKETENGVIGFGKKHSEQDQGALDFSGSYVRASKNKITDSATYNPELGLKLKLAEDRTIDSDNSFLSYILRGYNTSGEEGSSQGSYGPRKINESCFFPMGNIGRHSLLMGTGENVKDQDYTPNEKRRKTNADRNFDTDHRKRRVKNNEASKRHRESKKKLQKEAFDNITKLEEINRRLKRKAEKLDSAVKQVLKVITTLSTNS